MDVLVDVDNLSQRCSTGGSRDGESSHSQAA